MALQLAKQALSLYDLPGNATVTLISISENEIYKVESASGAAWALRLQRPGYQSKNSLASEISWLAALRKDGVLATPVPVPGLNGEWVQECAQAAQHPTNPDPRNMVLFEWQNGREPEIAMDLRQCFRHLGAISAQMHAHSRKWQRPKDFERFAWNFETTLGETPRWGNWRDGLGMSAASLDLFSRTSLLIRDRLARYGCGRERFGLAHCDLRLGNLLLHQDQVKVIDFDDCGFSWYMYDAATTVSFYEHHREIRFLSSCGSKAIERCPH